MSDLTYIVTGASRGIGIEIVKHLVNKYNANVVTISRSLTDELKSLSNDKVIPIQGDVKDSEISRIAVETAISKFGKLNGLVLNHGVLTPLGKISDVKPEEFLECLNINTVSLLNPIQKSLDYLRESKGNVVFVSSGAATGSYAAWGAYNSSKAAMNSICRTLANEEPDITSIAVRPGVVDTDMQGQIRLLGDAHMLPNDYKKFYDLFTNNKLVKADEPAKVLAELVVNKKHQYNGQFLSFDGEELKDLR